MVLMVMGIDLEGEEPGVEPGVEPGEVSKCMMMADRVVCAAWRVEQACLYVAKCSVEWTENINKTRRRVQVFAW